MPLGSMYEPESDKTKESHVLDDAQCNYDSNRYEYSNWSLPAAHTHTRKCSKKKAPTSQGGVQSSSAAPL